MPQISVVVTTFNRKEFLTTTIKSILSQTFMDFELLVVDNYSNYNFNSLINSFNDNRIRAFQNQNNGIIAVNRNNGIKRSKGELLAFCDDDDFWFRDKLETQINYFNNSNIIGVGSSALVFCGDGRQVIGKIGHRKNNTIGLNDLLIDGGVPLSSLIINRRDVFFNESRDLVAVEDFEFQLKLLIKSPQTIFYVNRYLVNYRSHEQNYYNRVEDNKLRALLVVNKYIKRIKKQTYNKFFFQIVKLTIINTFRKRGMLKALRQLFFCIKYYSYTH